MPKTEHEKKLLKNANKFAALEKELQLVLPPKVFAAIEEMARCYLEESRFDDISREKVSKLAFILRQETYTRFGHESLETIALSKVLQRTHKGWVQPPPRLDSISYMRTYHKLHRLDTQQESAAAMIRVVWDAFGKFRFIGARGMGGGGGGSGQNLHPLDVMGEETWQHYQEHYVPWYKKAAMISVTRRRYLSVEGLSLAGVVFKILVEDYFPEEVDKGYGLVDGMAYRALRAALTGYYDHEALESFVNPGGAATETRVDERSGRPAKLPASHR